jgi:hypothetical protein
MEKTICPLFELRDRRIRIFPDKAGEEFNAFKRFHASQFMDCLNL